MSDFPMPTAGGSYLRDDATGELVRISGTVVDMPAPPPVTDAEPSAPETPAEEK